MDRLSKLLLIPTSVGTLAGLGLGQMTNVLQPYWPDAPHWVFAVLFWSGAALTFLPLPAWILWLVWKDRNIFSRRVSMIFGLCLVLGGCALGVIGLSIIAAGESPVPASPPPVITAPVGADSFLSFEDAIRLASDRLNDVEYFSLLNLSTRDRADAHLLGWANRLKSRVTLYSPDGKPISASASVKVSEGKVFVGDKSDLLVRKDDLESALTRARLDYPSLSRPGSNAINTVDSPGSRIIGNKAGEINVHRGPGTDIINNDVRRPEDRSDASK